MSFPLLLPFQLSWKLAGSCVPLTSPVDSWSSLLFAQAPPGDTGSETHPPIPRGSWQQMSAHYNFHVTLQFIVPSLCKKPTTTLTAAQMLTPHFITRFPNAVVDPSLVIYTQCPNSNYVVNFKLEHVICNSLFPCNKVLYNYICGPG